MVVTKRIMRIIMEENEIVCSELVPILMCLCCINICGLYLFVDP